MKKQDLLLVFALAFAGSHSDLYAVEYDYSNDSEGTEEEDGGVE